MSDFMQPARGELRHKFAPLVDRGFAQPERSSGAHSAVEVFDHVRSAHLPESTTVDMRVNHNRRGTFTSGTRDSALPLDMDKKRHRVRPSAYFNGAVIRELRKNRELSLERLAETIGTTKANVSKWELARAQVEISYSLFLALARALYVAPEELGRRLATPPAPEPAPHARATHKRTTG